MFNNRLKRKEPEINELRCAPMDPHNLGRSIKVQTVPQLKNLDPVTLTQQFQSLQYYNYMTYMQQMQIATGDLSFGLDEQQAMLRPFMMPEREPTAAAPLTYGEYRRKNNLDEGGYQGSNGSSQQARNNYRKSGTVDDGWSDDPPAQRSSNNRGGPPRYPRAQVSDGWDDEPSTSKSVKPKPKENDWDDDDSPRKPKKLIGTDDWDEPGLSSRAPKTAAKKKDDDWSDDEVSNSCQPKSYGNGHSSNTNRSREGSNTSRHGSDSHDSRSFSRERSFRGRGSGYRHGSNDRNSSYDGSTKTYEQRPPRDGDWECSKCKKSNFKFRTECYRCNEPKAEGAQSSEGSQRSGGYRGRSDGYRGRGGRGGYRDRGARNGSSGRRGGYNSSSSFSSAKPLATGWSDDEDSSTKAVPAKSTNDDGWDDEKPKTSSVPQRQMSSDDDGDKPDSKNAASSSSVCADIKAESGQERKLGEQSSSAPKQQINDDDLDNDKPAGEMPAVKFNDEDIATPAAMKIEEKNSSPKRKLEDEDDWDNVDQPATKKKAEDSTAGDDEWDLPKESEVIAKSASAPKPTTDED